MLGERNGAGYPVMPVRHDVHRAGGATFLADEAPGDCRPGQILGQGVERDVDHASIAGAGRALDVAGHVTVGAPASRGAKREFVGRS